MQSAQAVLHRRGKMRAGHVGLADDALSGLGFCVLGVFQLACLSRLAQLLVSFSISEVLVRVCSNNVIQAAGRAQAPNPRLQMPSRKVPKDRKLRFSWNAVWF